MRPDGRRAHYPRRLAAVALAGLLWLTGCAPTFTSSISPGGGPTTNTGSPSASASVPAGLASFYSQHLTWTPCGQGHECATASVPLDYADPTGPTLTLNLKRIKATQTPRAGTLFANPGGPGVGTDAGDWFDRTGLEQYDLVTWDPRGTGTNPVVCADAAATDQYLATDFSPDDPAEENALSNAEKFFADSCLAHTSREHLEHVSTAENARDLDILRAAVGDEKLTFYGASYGTLLGALYADLFPGRVARIVLDSPVDVTGAEAVKQSAAMEASLRSFAAWCASEGQCGWGSDADGVTRALQTWLTSLDAAPLAVNDRVLTQSLAALGVTAFLYPGRTGWPGLRDAITAAIHGNPTLLLTAADTLDGRRPDGTYSSQLAAGSAILCADRPHPTTKEALATWKTAQAQAPVLGYLAGPDLLCTAWPTPQRPWTTPHATTAPAILVVGATGDPATPYAWAQTTAATLATARLLTYDGQGHVSYGRSDCVDQAVRDYLHDGTIPDAALCR